MTLEARLERIQRQAVDLGNAMLALDLANQAYRQHPAQRFHYRRLVDCLAGQLLRRQPARELARQVDLHPELREVLLRHQAAPTPAPRSRTGAARALFVAQDGDTDPPGPVGFIAWLELERRPSGSGSVAPPGCGAVFAEALDRAHCAVFRLLGQRHRFNPGALELSRVRLRVRGPAAAEHYLPDGASIGAAAAVVWFSAWTGAPVPCDVALTGAVTADGKLAPVDHLPAKVSAALRELPGLRLVLVPTNCDAGCADPRVKAVADLEQLLRQVFGDAALRQAPAALLDVEGTVRLGIHCYEKLASHATARAILNAALEAIDLRRQQQQDPRLYRVEQFLALWRAGSATIHAGDPEAAGSYLERARALAEELWQQQVLAPGEYYGFRGNLAVLWRDCFRYTEAVELLEQSLEQQRRFRVGQRELAKTLGNLGELRSFIGRRLAGQGDAGAARVCFDQAEQELQQALANLLEVAPDEVPREHCYLGNLALARGEPQQALRRYARGMTSNQTARHGQQANEAYLGHGQVRALLAAGQPEQAARRAEALLATMDPQLGPYPRQSILKHRGSALLALGQQAEGRAALLSAGDLSHARGSLLRFGVATALARLACHLLADDPADHAQGLELAHTFANEASAVPGLERVLPGGLERLQRGLARGLEQPHWLAELVDQTARCFPY